MFTPVFSFRSASTETQSWKGGHKSGYVFALNNLTLKLLQAKMMFPPMPVRDQLTLSPLQKWRKYRRLPYKFTVHVLIVCLCSALVSPPFFFSSFVGLSKRRSYYKRHNTQSTQITPTIPFKSCFSPRPLLTEFSPWRTLFKLLINLYMW